MVSLKPVRNALITLGILASLAACAVSPDAMKQVSPVSPAVAAEETGSSDLANGSGLAGKVACDARKNDTRFSQLVDSSYYLLHNPDVQALVVAGRTTALSHFLCVGQYEGRRPNRLFDEAIYIASNNDVATAVTYGNFATGFEHFALYGQREGRVAMNEVSLCDRNGTSSEQMRFSETDYLEENPAVQALVENGEWASGLAYFVQVEQKSESCRSTLVSHFAQAR